MWHLNSFFTLLFDALSSHNWSFHLCRVDSSQSTIVGGRNYSPKPANYLKFLRNCQSCVFLLARSSSTLCTYLGAFKAIAITLWAQYIHGYNITESVHATKVDNGTSGLGTTLCKCRTTWSAI